MLNRPDILRKLVLAPRPCKLLDVLSVEEIARLLEVAPGTKYRAALGVAYGAGLRGSDVAHFEADDFYNKPMLIRIGGQPVDLDAFPVNVAPPHGRRCPFIR